MLCLAFSKHLRGKWPRWASHNQAGEDEQLAVELLAISSEGGRLPVNDGVEGLFSGENGAVHNCSVSCIRGMFCACRLSAMPRILEAPEG